MSGLRVAETATMGVGGMRGITVSVPIIYSDDFNTVNHVTYPFTLKKKPQY